MHRKRISAELRSARVRECATQIWIRLQLKPRVLFFFFGKAKKSKLWDAPLHSIPAFAVFFLMFAKTKPNQKKKNQKKKTPRNGTKPHRFLSAGLSRVSFTRVLAHQSILVACVIPLAWMKSFDKSITLRLYFGTGSDLYCRLSFWAIAFNFFQSNCAT